MKTNNIKESLDKLQISDVFSLMFFLLYKIQDIPEYSILSELCYLLDGNNIIRLLTYFSGKTVKFPKESDFVVLADALLLYQHVNLEGDSIANAWTKLSPTTIKQKDKIMDLYLKIIPIINSYNINRSEMVKNAR